MLRRLDIHIHHHFDLSFESALRGANPEVLDALHELRIDIMATKEEVTAAIAALGTRIDDFIASQQGQTAAEVQKLLDEQKAKLTADDATMDAADFDEFAAGIAAITSRIPPKFDPSANG